MCDEWMPRLELPLTFEQFRQLPRNAAYKYEYFDELVWLNPRPRYYHALLDLEAWAARPLDGASHKAKLRPVQATDWEGLAPLFSAAFDRQQPFCGLDDERALLAARKALEHTRSGGDGPWIEQASFVATDGDAGHELGAILVTLLPDRDPSGWHSYHWDEQPPPDALAQRLGRPHLTWIFVSPFEAGHGVGTLLLSAAVRELLTLGYKQLASTFLIGNDSSMLWHWRNGFQLLSYPGSWRRRFEEMEEKLGPGEG
ncbi:MAG TPA: GNAT family N-acetyltransferase [Gemmataceae bacterium]|jgi:GNAT superfamily N-acetyltransferase